MMKRTPTQKMRSVSNFEKVKQTNIKTIKDEITSSPFDPTTIVERSLKEENDKILFMVEYHNTYYKGWVMDKFI